MTEEADRSTTQNRKRGILPADGGERGQRIPAGALRYRGRTIKRRDPKRSRRFAFCFTAIDFKSSRYSLKAASPKLSRSGLAGSRIAQSSVNEAYFLLFFFPSSEGRPDLRSVKLPRLFTETAFLPESPPVRCALFFYSSPSRYSDSSEPVWKTTRRTSPSSLVSSAISCRSRL